MLILRDEPLAAHNSLALMARARALVEVADERQLIDVLHWARTQSLPVIPLGGGSNVVIAGDLDALVMRLSNRGIEVLAETAEQVLLKVAAGEGWHELVQWCLRQGYYGLENTALIPGTVGAAPIQNIGAYGVELAPFVRRVHCLSIADGRMFTLAGDECEFGYRDSIFKRALRDQLVITAVELQLSRIAQVVADYPALAQELERRGDLPPTPEQVFDAVVHIRRSKLPDPDRLPNAGSFFKNPVLLPEQARALARRYAGLPLYPQGDGRIKLPAAWLIDHCGWKGFRRNDLGVHPEHALVLVNYGNNSGAQLLELAGEIVASVRERFDIALEVEPRIYGGAA
jgi:UDP-N-acetylmuramate dehydrogenase